MHARAQDATAQLKKPQRQKLPWMKDDEDMPAASGDLLTAAAPAAVAKVKAKAKAKAKAAAVEPAAAATAATATEVAATEVAAAAAAAAAATEVAAVAMAATETEPAEIAEVVQANARYLCRAYAPTTHAAKDHDASTTLYSAGASGAQEGRDHHDRRLTALARCLPARGLQQSLRGAAWPFRAVLPWQAARG
jgi:outer membrane receptor protein involved in Fe transport